MQQSDGFGAIYGSDERRAAWIATALAAALGLGLGSVLMLSQPALADQVRTLFEQRLGSTIARWVAPIIMLGLSTGIAGAGILLLAGFIRGARQRPFLTLAPLLCALSGATLGHLPMELSMGPLGSVNFALPTLLLALGGAALFQLKGLFAKIAGVLTWSLPAALLLTGAASYPGGFSLQTLLSPYEHPSAMILVLSWVTLAAIAWIAPDARDTVSRTVMRRQVSALEQRLAETEERARVLASAPTQANHAALASARNTITHLKKQLAQTEQQTLQNANLRETLISTQTRLRRLEASAILGHSRLASFFWLFVILSGTAAAITTTGHLLYLRPMQKRLATSVSTTASANSEVEKMREQLVEQRRDSAAALSALQNELIRIQIENKDTTTTRPAKTNPRPKVSHPPGSAATEP